MFQSYNPTGCPISLGTHCFCYFLGFQSTYRRTSDLYSTALEMRISKLTLLYFLREKLIKLQHKTWDKLDFESIILMADFASLYWGLPTLGSIISVISKSIFKILVPILMQISWTFQNTPNICILDEFEDSYGRFSTKRHFFWDTL